MNLRRIDPPREFTPKAESDVTITHCLDISLDDDEQVTFVSDSGTEVDVTRKSWGYYVGGSLNSRLPSHGVRPALMAGDEGRIWLLGCERGSEDDFLRYCEREGMELVVWLDEPDVMTRLRALR